MALTFVSTLAAYVLNAPAALHPMSSARPPTNLAMGLSNIEDCMLLSIFFNDGTTVAEVEALVHSYPFEGLRGFASVDKDAPDGTRLTFAVAHASSRCPTKTTPR
jgi:hypothetical protein